MRKKNKLYIEVPDIYSLHNEYYYVQLDHCNVLNLKCKNEFLHIDDAVEGILKISRRYLPEITTIYLIEYEYDEIDFEKKEVKMLDNILNKNVTIFRKDGNILQGFISGIDGDFIKMIELDNEEIIFNKDCIDLIRLKIINLENTEEKVERAERQVVLPQARKVSRREQPYEFLDDENPNYDEKCISSGPDEFSMSVKRIDEDSKYQVPSFIRSTSREE